MSVKGKDGFDFEMVDKGKAGAVSIAESLMAEIAPEIIYADNLMPITRGIYAAI